jgi:L-iditol 2-dehydrogenase
VLGLAKQAAGPGGVGLVERPVPTAGPGEALVEVIATGVCGTDLHILDGTYASRPPVTMGHEVTGVVVAVGEGADPAWIGVRVASETFHSTCGACPWCRDGRPNLCRSRASIGSGVDGGFAALVAVPARNLHRLPDTVSRYAGALCEPLACVCQSLLARQHVAAGDDVLVLGPGAIGLLAAQVARAAGGRVLVVGTDRDAVRLTAARRLGFDTALASERPAMEALGGGHGPHVVVECSGSEAAMATALEVVRPGGRHVQIGQTAARVAVPFALTSFKEIEVSGGFASTPRSWRQAMALLERGQVELDPLISEVAPLADWERVFDDTAHARGIKYVLAPGAP